MRYFSLHEAEALIPELEGIFGRALKLRDEAEAKARRLREREEGEEGDPARDVLERGQLQFLVNAVNGCLAEVSALGAIPKGLDPALVDFPHRLDGAEVYLCWRGGEKSITHYHGLEDGFAGRRALPKGTRPA
ncbi:MAG: DUF2203 domain-containing protein [Elusimicrobia bacterium]|nr:DUF2203 domain-containing protein [Elusimicrobiota bacterium]